MSSKEQIENEIKILNERFWEELKNDNFDEVDLILKKVKNCEMILRIEEDTEEIKPIPTISESEMLDFLKRIKHN